MLALALLVVLAPVMFFVETAWLAASGGIGGAIAPGAVLFLLTGLMGLPILRRTGLTRRELLTVYCIVCVAFVLYQYTVFFYIIPKVPLYYHMARANPAWETVFLQHLPLWFSPTDPAALEGFFLGSGAVPWALWAKPMAAWSAFMFCLFFSTFCLLALVQRQWVTNERLSFPLAQVPLLTTNDPASQEGRRSARLPLARAFWIGLAISLILNFLATLQGHIPSLPKIPIGLTTVIPRQNVGPLAGLGEFVMCFWPWLLGLLYLLPKELLFSTWFFWFLRLGLHVIAIAAGATPMDPQEWYGSNFPAPYHQGTGALMAIGAWSLWVGRRHLRRALRIALSRESGRADADQPLSYRMALLGLLLSTAGMVYFCHAAGCRVLFGAAIAVVFVGYYFAFSRMRAETAMDPSVLDMYQVMTMPGTGLLLPQEATALVTFRWATFPGGMSTFAGTAAMAIESFKIGDAAGLNLRRLAYGIIGGVVLAIMVGWFVFLQGIYHYGYFGTSAGSAPWWPSMQSRQDGNMIMEFITHPSRFDALGLTGVAAGAVVAIVLGIFRLRLWWWPFHPVGYIIANGWGMHWYLVPFLLAWSAKLLVIRYGGLRLYRQTVPLAVGLIVGDMLNGTLWSFIALASGGAIKTRL
jgi:hypothetical protein